MLKKTYIQDVGCLNCGIKCGQVVLNVGEKYKGNYHYGFRCDPCQLIMETMSQVKKLRG